MRKSWVLMIGLSALTGCALEPDVTAATADASDPACMAAADARARDAAINGYDKSAQLAIRQESHNSCMVWGKKTTLVEHGRR